MIEIAISLAIIGFALAAVVGVLPLGMRVQKQNREETIINQDAIVLMDAIRNGSQGFDDLTNYVFAITNSVVGFTARGLPSGFKQTYWYTPTASSTPSQFPINTGSRIIGLLSTPTYLLAPDGSYLSNHVAAYIRSLSGPASEKFPQSNKDVQDLAFGYRLTPEIVPYWTNYVDPTWTINPNYPDNTTNAVAWTNYVTSLIILQTNLHDVRLSFRWPLLARNAPGPGQQSFHTIVGGILQETNELNFLRPNPSIPSGYDLYYFQPRTYVNVKAP
jgi:type II secretory pathway pseudopilin PulG